MTTQTETKPESTLTVADRCDRCGAQARVIFAMPINGEILMCKHDADKHGDAVQSKGGIIVQDIRREI